MANDAYWRQKSFLNKRYTIYSDETSGIGGRNRPTTYGVYDNKRGRIDTSTGRDDIAAIKLAVKKNKGIKPYIQD